MAARYR